MSEQIFGFPVVTDETMDVPDVIIGQYVEKPKGESLKWSTQPPVSTGWYWARDRDNTSLPIIVKVEIVETAHGEGWVSFPAQKEKSLLSKVRGVLWAGPISEPVGRLTDGES